MIMSTDASCQNERKLKLKSLHSSMLGTDIALLTVTKRHTPMQNVIKGDAEV